MRKLFLSLLLCGSSYFSFASTAEVYASTAEVYNYPTNMPVPATCKITLFIGGASYVITGPSCAKLMEAALKLTGLYRDFSSYVSDLIPTEETLPSLP